MSTQTLNRYDAITSPVGSSGLFARLVSWVGEQRRYRRTLGELSQLTDRELADIGLSRSEIDLVAKRTSLQAR
jgi:uncharacterized protein YjiS (DUF1127 family)